MIVAKTNENNYLEIPTVKAHGISKLLFKFDCFFTAACLFKLSLVEHSLGVAAAFMRKKAELFLKYNREGHQLSHMRNPSYFHLSRTKNCAHKLFHNDSV